MIYIEGVNISNLVTIICNTEDFQKFHKKLRIIKSQKIFLQNNTNESIQLIKIHEDISKIIIVVF